MSVIIKLSLSLNFGETEENLFEFFVFVFTLSYTEKNLGRDRAIFSRNLNPRSHKMKVGATRNSRNSQSGRVFWPISSLFFALSCS